MYAHILIPFAGDWLSPSLLGEGVSGAAGGGGSSGETGVMRLPAGDWLIGDKWCPFLIFGPFCEPLLCMNRMS